MKVPVQTDDDAILEPEDNEQDNANTAAREAADAVDMPDVASEDTAALEPDEVELMDEEAMVEAAIRAGEQAAEADFKAEAEKRQTQLDELANELATTQQEAIEARAQADEAQEKYLRLQADWENFRKRTAQERATEKVRANEGLVSKILPVIDDMERALAHSRQNAAGNEMLLQFADGMDAVRAKLVGVLAGEGVEVINPVGEPFDPLLHQAVGRVEDTEGFADTVREVYQPGYSMGGKVIREAMVTVTYGGPVRPAPEEADSEAQADVAEDASAADSTGEDANNGMPTDE
ncbi:MAG: nucleotide exchange factor GrpE [Atopobiaceae bacterium]|nr:nucleotide exchange factor GrpE [Atopobiaceae bacterium]